MTSVDFALAQRLLCVCNLAYGVGGSSDTSRAFSVAPPVLPSEEVIAEMEASAGLARASLHTHQTADRSGIDAFLYGETPDAAILAFRGTLPVRLAAEPGRLWQIVADWINNANAALVDGSPYGLPGFVHAGFGESLQTLWNAEGGLRSILPRITGAVAEGKKFFVTGHSKGGALACLAALRLASAGDASLEPQAVVTFAAPRPGNQDVAAAFARKFPERAWRFEYQDDIVPQLPPTEGFWFALRETLGRVARQTNGAGDALSRATLIAGLGALTQIGSYESAGRLQFIDWAGNLVDDDTPRLQTERIRRLARILVTSLPTIGKAHLPMRGFGYMNFLESRVASGAARVPAGES